MNILLTKQEYKDAKSLAKKVPINVILHVLFPSKYRGKNQKFIGMFTSPIPYSILSKMGYDLMPNEFIKRLKTIGIYPTVDYDDSYSQCGNPATIITGFELSDEWQNWRDKVIQFKEFNTIVVDPATGIAAKQKEIKETGCIWHDILNKKRNIWAKLRSEYNNLADIIDNDYQNQKISKESHDYNITVLRSTYNFPQPTYKNTANSPRLWAEGHNLIQMSSKYRDLLFQSIGWSYLDLASCHFCVFGSLLLDSDLARPYLEQIKSGNSLWNLFCEEIPEVPRDMIKKILYTVIYGGDAMTIKLKYEEFAPFILKHPIFKAMIKEATNWRKRAKSEGKVTMLDGTEFIVTNDNEAKTALSYFITCYEVDLVKLAELEFNKVQNINLTAHIHDGFALTGPKNDIKERLPIVQNALNKRAEELGIVCRLELKY